MAKTIRELRGESCIEIEEVTPAKQQIINSRSFGQSVTEIEDLQEAVAHFVTNAAIKLRAQDSVSALLQVFIMTNRFKPNERQYCPSASLNLPIPTSDTLLLQNAAMQGLNAIYRPGFKYKKAGVILSGITSSAHNQGDLFETPVRGEALMQTLDMLNRKFGKGAVRISQDAGRRRWAMRQDHKSPAYTTRWDELAVCR